MEIAPKPSGKLPVLISYHYMRQWSDDRIAYVLGNPNCEVLLDSGAFSALNAGATIDLVEYMEFLHRWKDKLFGYMLLDKLGDPEVTASNYERMLDAGLRPIPIHVRGDDEDRMNYLFDRSAYVALGGLRRPKVGWCKPGYITLKMKWAAGRPVHWLGYTRQEMLAAFKPYSCDSSNNDSAAMYGRLIYCDGMKLKSVAAKDFIKSGSVPLAISKALDHVGASVADLCDPATWRSFATRGQRTKEFLTAQITLHAHVLYAMRWSSVGVRVFLASVNARNGIDHMFDYWNRLNPQVVPYEVESNISEPARPVSQWFK